MVSISARSWTCPVISVVVQVFCLVGRAYRISTMLMVDRFPGKIPLNTSCGGWAPSVFMLMPHQVVVHSLNARNAHTATGK